MKRLTVALLLFSVFAPTVFAQSAEQEERDKIFSAWREIVSGAERDYKNKNGRYGDLAALRKAHLLRSLVVESCSSAASGIATGNFVPKSTLIDAVVSADGQFFFVMILEHSGRCFGPPMYNLMPDLQDSPEGPMIAG